MLPGGDPEGIPVTDAAHGTYYVVTGGAGALAYNIAVSLFCGSDPDSATPPDSAVSGVDVAGEPSGRKGGGCNAAAAPGDLLPMLLAAWALLRAGRRRQAGRGQRE